MMQSRPQPRPPTRRHRRGSTVLQTVVVMTVMLAVSMGAVEFGQFLYIRHAFEAAARDAARAGSLPTGTTAAVTSAATAALLQANVTLNASWMTINDISSDGSTTTPVTDVTTIPSGDRVQVLLSTPYGQIPNAFRPLYQIFGKGIGPAKVMAAASVQVKE